MIRPGLLSLLALATPMVAGGRGTSPTTAEIDAQAWAAVIAAVANADIVAMGRTYHPAAVLVTTQGTKPIAEALAGWGKDMVAAKRDGVHAELALRFASRQDDATTAFETGVFRYTTIDRTRNTTPRYVRFEALFVKTRGRWQTVMERQLGPVTERDWDQLPH